MNQAISSGISKIKSAGRFLWAKRLRVAVLAGVLSILLALGLPKPLQGQLLPDPCCAILSAALGVVNTTLNSVVGALLNTIQSVDQNILNFEQNVVYDLNAINAARSLVGNVQGFANQIQNIVRIPVNSATLPESQQLEQNLLSHDPTQIPQTAGLYTAVYGALPDVNAASPEVRNQIDMTDAAIKGGMDTAIQYDAIMIQEKQAADQISQSIQTAAPGSAPIIEAQADAWVIRANAYTQALLAAWIRLHALDTANTTAKIKGNAAQATAIQQHLLDLLTRR
jgi:hypothetical protein